MAVTTPRLSTPRSARSARSNTVMPFLPGFVGKETKSFHNKSQSLAYGPGGTMDAAKPLVMAGLSAGLRSNAGSDLPKIDMSHLKALKDPFHRYDLSARSVTHDERNRMRESARNSYRPAHQPAWLKHDRQVLKFHAYFQEPVHENPNETFRIRCCTIFFYLEDGTMMVTEPKTENSGIPQGAFVKRHRVPRPAELGGGFYAYEDMTVGVTISIYSRAFRLTGCDDFTRHFYEVSLGVTMPENEAPPVDSFKAADLADPEDVVSARRALLNEAKEFNHISLGGNRRNEKLEQYLENDRKVLRFQCYWDDATKYGTRKYYILHYYLSDDTVEMLEVLSRNSGCDPYPVFWKRSPLRKNPHVSPAPGMMEPTPVVYKPEDFLVGDTIDVLGRGIVLYDCDEFTRDFYRSYMGFEQESYKIEEPKIKHVKLVYPPHQGIGTEEDSLESCKRLLPRPPRKDVKKLLLEGDNIMRFEALMANEIFEDENRRFIVAIYQADNSVCAWELKMRNSGHSEGKFASRSRKRNPATGTWFKPSDFYVGGIVEVNSCPFHLVGADEAALKYMEERPHEFPVADIHLILMKMMALKEYLQELSGPIECSELQMVAKDMFKIDFVDHELITLARKFGKYTPGGKPAFVNASELVNALG